MEQFERDSILRLIDYLEVVNDPHRNASTVDDLHRDFKKFFRQYDIRRNKVMSDIFPEILSEWANK